MDNQNELHDEENGIVDEAAQMPVGTEEESISSVKKAENAGKTAKKRRGDKSGGDMTADKVETKGPEKHSESFDYEEGLENLMQEEATLSEDFKAKTAIIFETALKSKLSEEVERLEEEYETRLNEEVSSMHDEIVEKVDSYLNYVVENWMTENELAIQQGLRTEIAENFMGGLKDLFTESYIDVPESKVDLVDGLAEEVEELQAKLNEQTEILIALSEQNEELVRDAILAEASYDLADTQADKLASLVENVDFEDAETFANKVATVKESFFNKKSASAEGLNEETADDGSDTDVVETSSAMDRYLNAMRKINNQ